MCCGRLRQRIASQTRANSGVPAAAVAARRPRGGLMSSASPVPADADATFEYNGATALTVVSPLTGKIYRFDSPGSRVEVDPRDRSWVAFVPSLRLAGRP
jgi:hypothetical protein